MILWKSVLRVSFKTQVYSTLIYGALAMGLLFAPWPAETSFIWLPVILLIIAGWGRTQHKISKRTGSVSLYNQNRILWRKNEWEIIKPPILPGLVSACCCAHWPQNGKNTSGLPLTACRKRHGTVLISCSRNILIFKLTPVTALMNAIYRLVPFTHVVVYNRASVSSSTCIHQVAMRSSLSSY